MARRLLVLALVATALVVSGSDARGSAPGRISIDNGAQLFAGDGPHLTTISPNGDGFRDRALVHLDLAGAATVTMEVRRGLPVPKVILVRRWHLPAGRSTVSWVPGSRALPGAYRLHVVVGDTRPARDLVVHVQGIDAGFEHASYAPGAVAVLGIASDAPSCSVRFYRVGPDREPTTGPNTMEGSPVGPPRILSPCGSRRHTRRVRLGLGRWTSGLYFAQLHAADGRIGFAPFVLRPSALGTHRIAVIEPTFTWQAYNFRDEDGNGTGDTWYAGWSRITVDTTRAYLNRGVPPHFRWYDLQFLRWLARENHAVDVLADEDLDTIAGGGDALAAAYDLIVFPGHHEYVTETEYDNVERFRDAGGNLMFLSANNFFWKVVRRGSTLRRVAEWRDLGRPEAALVGVQYRGNDNGRRRGPFTIRNAPPWLLRDSGLAPRSRFGRYGIEIDARAPSSPPGTRVLADIRELYGAGFNAEMTLYRSAAGGEVFAAGAFTLAGTAQRPVVSALLTNLWERLTG